MTAFDIRMFLTGYVLSILFCTILMTSLWWQNRKISPEIILWLADYLLQFAGVLLITLRGILPDFFTIVIANVLVILGNIILYIGLGRYVGKESRQLHNYVMLAVFTLVHFYLTYVHPDFNLRVVNISIAYIYICAQCSWLMLRRAEPHLRPITRITGIVFAVFCFFCIIQVTVNLTIPKINNLFLSGFLGISAILTYQIAFIALSIALFLMVSSRLSISLENELFQRKRAEWTLKERFKELNCLYGISALIELPDISGEEILKKTVMLLPPAWQFPEITEARITMEGQIFQTERFRETPWMQSYKIMVHGKPAGQIEVCYLEERPVSDEGPFLIEERHLINAIAQRLGHVIERNMAEEQIRRNETRLKSLLNIIQYRTKTTQEFLDYALNEVINLTQSKIGYIYFYYEDRQQFVLNTWSKDVMKECMIANPQTCYELGKTGIWGEAVRQRKPIVLNNFEADHPLKRGYPEGHAPLNNFMTIPVFKEDSIVAVVGVANKASDYDETDVLQLTLFMEAVWKSVDIKIGEEKLRKSEERFKQLAEVFPETIFEANMEGNVTYANEHGLKHFGLTEEDIAKGVNIFDMVSPHDRNLAQERMQSRMLGISKGYLEYQAMKKDGSTFYALALSVPIMVEGIPVGIRGFIMDINERKQAESQREAALEALRESEARISAITNYANDAIMMMDNNGTISYWNPAAEHILGYTSAEAIGKNLHELIAPERFLAGHLAAFPEFQKTGRGNAIGKTLELAARRKDGCEIDVNLSLSAVKIESAWHSVGIMQDITEHKQAEAALVRLSRQNELILNSAAEGILGLDLQGNHTFVNSAAAKMFGYEVEELIGRPGHSTWHHTKPDGKPYPAEECKIHAVHLDGIVRRVSTEVFWRKDGSSFPVEYASTPIYEQGRTAGVVVTFADITERKKTEEQIQHLATHDLLTDLPSLRLANDRLSSALNMARRYKKAVALMFIDLDGFKNVNDTLGHDAGDYVLKQVAQRMLSCVRETDTVARIGGDEFLIIATEINNPENAAQIAQKVIHTVSQPFIFHGQQAIVGTSIGIALFPDHGEDVDQLIKQADEAMYKVKNSGKNNFRFVDDTAK